MKQRKTVEDYLKAVYLLQKQNGSVRGADIAAELHVSRPTVSVSLKELEKEGYLFLDGAREVHLTDKGQTVARETYERHQDLPVPFRRPGRGWENCGGGCLPNGTCRKSEKL